MAYPCCTNVSKLGDNDATAYVGSTVTGNTRAGSASQPASGVTDNTARPRPSCRTARSTLDTLTGSPVRSSTAASHATAGANRDRTTPETSTNDTDPSASARAVNPFVASGNSHDTTPTGRDLSTNSCS